MASACRDDLGAEQNDEYNSSHDYDSFDSDPEDEYTGPDLPTANDTQSGTAAAASQNKEVYINIERPSDSPAKQPCGLPDIVPMISNPQNGGGHRYKPLPIPPVCRQAQLNIRQQCNSSLSPSGGSKSSAPRLTGTNTEQPKHERDAANHQQDTDVKKATFPRYPAPPVPKYRLPSNVLADNGSRCGDDDSVRLLRRFSWFFDNLTRAEAEDKLRSNTRTTLVLHDRTGSGKFTKARINILQMPISSSRNDGSFLVRRSEQGDDQRKFSLSLLFKGEVFHVRIRCQPEDKKYVLGEPKPNNPGPVFFTVEQLIEFYLSNSIELSNLPAGSAGKSVKLQYCQR